MESQKSFEEYIAAYKTFEKTVCSAHNLSRLSYVGNSCDRVDSVCSFESAVSDPDIKDKVHVCRVIYEYAKHHEDANMFLSAPSSMTGFLKEKTNDILLLDSTAKDIMRPYPISLTEESTVAEFAAALSEMHLTVCPYKRMDGSIDVASFVDIGIALGRCNPKTEKYCTANKGTRQPAGFVCATQDTPISSLPKGEMIVVLAQAEGEIVGVILPKDIPSAKETANTCVNV